MIAKSEATTGEHPVFFAQPWWLEAVAPGGWHEITVERGGEVFARLPYVMTQKQGFRILTLPPFTQCLGPWLRPYPGKLANQVSEEKQLMNELIEQLPPCDVFSQNFHYTFTNWLPFYWKGYQQTTRYTYILDDLTDSKKLLDEFAHFKRKNIHRASKLVEVQQDLDPEVFYRFHQSTLQKSGDVISYDQVLFLRIHQAAYAHDAGKTFYAVDASGNLHSAIFIVWNAASAYYLISAIDPDFRNSGASTQLVWEAIQFCAARTSVFDFEGSMIENVENSFRAFGAKQKPYFAISKIHSLRYRIGRDLRDWWQLRKGNP